MGLPGGAVIKNLSASAGDARDSVLIPGLGRSLGEEMATHSNTLAWKIPWTEEPGRLQSTGSLRVGHNQETSLSLLCTEGNGNQLQYFCLENPMDRGAWWATVHGVAKSRTRLSDLTLTLTSYRYLFRSQLSVPSAVYLRVEWLGRIVILYLLF